jgi:hypothetical protein
MSGAFSQYLIRIDLIRKVSLSGRNEAAALDGFEEVRWP